MQPTSRAGRRYFTPAEAAPVERRTTISTGRVVSVSAGDLPEAEDLARVAKAGKALLILTYSYAGYPMIREARRLVAEGQLGRIRLMHVEFVSDWLARPGRAVQPGWRADPALGGEGGVIADIGTHAAHLATYVSGLSITEVAAELTAFVEGRQVDDNGHAMLRLGRGARGMLWTS